MKSINITYFAIFRDHSGVDAEKIETNAATAAELFAELERRHAFPALSTVKVAINDEFADWNADLSDGDAIVFIPPVAGG